ncbi:MAG: dTDP-glucose 4,6-dehydratase [Chloroflexota bacterium]|nr:MAG: dTDP-glucose 4,6-dehydratase [Chloroflexota bacterium]
MKRLFVTGAAGFIGSNLVRHLLADDRDVSITILDKLTYAGRRETMRDFLDDPRVRFVEGDICDASLVEELVQGADAIVNVAAESHVDRSILGPAAFVQTNIVGTFVLLEAARKAGVGRFLQVSTDEVYGSIASGTTDESFPLDPRNPYAATKAGAELLARSYFTTYKLPVVITRGANNYGPFQFIEKAIPLFTTNAIDRQPLPVYGDGRQERHWMHVLDHCAGIDLVLREGIAGEIYNIGTDDHRPNMYVVEQILAALDRPRDLIRHVSDRPGHDIRYSLDSSKVRALGWEPTRSFESGLEATVRWYEENEWWWRPIKSGEYARYYEQNYAWRATAGSR